MHKLILLLIALAVVAGYATGQDLQPIRVGVAVLAAGYEGISFEYAYPLESQSIGLEINIGSRWPPFDRYIATELGLRYYLFNIFAKGLYVSPSYTMTIDREREAKPFTHSVKLCGGYRFIVFKHFTLYLSIGYLYQYEPWRGDPEDFHAHYIATELGFGGVF